MTSYSSIIRWLSQIRDATGNAKSCISCERCGPENDGNAYGHAAGRAWHARIHFLNARDDHHHGRTHYPPVMVVITPLTK